MAGQVARPLESAWLDALASRRRFGMKPGLDAMRALCARLGDPQKTLAAIHVAGTDGKGAVCAMLDACLREAGRTTGRYTSPHLVAVNERFFIDGAPAPSAALAPLAREVEEAAAGIGGAGGDATFFEALTALAFLFYAKARPDWTILETGLGGRLDATNICSPRLCAITRIGLDHCDWLGDTVEKIAAEKAGIIKPGVPVVLGENVPSVREVVRVAAERAGAPFHYAPDIASKDEIPAGFSLSGGFNRENAQTAIAALKVLGEGSLDGLCKVVWPGRFQRAGRFIVDGAHNPPAARALVDSLRDAHPGAKFDIVAGFCADKDIDATLRILAPVARRAFATASSNPRSIAPRELARRMAAAGIAAEARPSLRDALDAAGEPAVVCGSLFIAGEALLALGAYPWPAEKNAKTDPSELLKPGIPPAPVDGGM